MDLCLDLSFNGVLFHIGINGLLKLHLGQVSAVDFKGAVGKIKELSFEFNLFEMA